MDNATQWIGYISIGKDCLTSIAAVIDVCVACKGVKTRQRQLKGTTLFDVTKRLMFKVYQIRQDIAYCRAVCRVVPPHSHVGEGENFSATQYQYVSTKKNMLGRFFCR